MRGSRVPPILLAIALVAVAAIGLLPVVNLTPSQSHVSPFLKIGPQAVPVATGNLSGVFTCQVGQADVICYDPFQMRHAYNIDKLISNGYDGSGKTIVIIDAFQSAKLQTDLTYFINFYGLPKFNTGGPTFTQIAPDGLGPVDDGWAGEITLDVEWAHAIAPNANIVLVLAKSNADTDILSATSYAVYHRLGDVITQSFGENESCVDPSLLAQEHKIFQDAVQAGIALFASAGDDGAGQPSCDGSTLVKAASSPASDPLVTAVGGTELHAADYCLVLLGCNPATHPVAGTYKGEIVWNEWTDGVGATGGGYSVRYNIPLYQQLTTPLSKTRGEPDVAYNAAVYHGVLTRFYGGWYLFGGTSAGSPQWAALTAITDQWAGHNLGFINTGVYKIGRLPSIYGVSFHDVTQGNNTVAPYVNPGFSATVGWDATTGLGSPIADKLAKYLTQYVSPNDGLQAIVGSNPHVTGMAVTTGTGKVKPH